MMHLVLLIMKMLMVVDDNSNPIYTTVNAVFKEDQKTDLLRSILKQFQYDIKSK